MSLISLGARSYLDRRQAWGNPKGQLSTLGPDELKALLQMAQSEGQTEVERWIRDAMNARGIYASKRSPIRIQSKMAPSEWLEKAMVLVLAGGIMLSPFGGDLPTVDDTSGAGQQPAVTHVYEQGPTKIIGAQHAGFQPGEVQELVDATRRAAQSFPDAQPNRSVVIEFVDVVSSRSPGANGYHIDGDIKIKINGNRIPETIVHEVAHALTPDNPSGEWVYDNHSTLHRDVLQMAKVQLGIR